MAIESVFKYDTTKDIVKKTLNPYLIDEDKRYDELTLRYLNKYIWLYFYEEEEDRNQTCFMVKYSHSYEKDERDSFDQILMDLGYTILNDE